MSKNWKDKLLSSGFPLEYEVSNLLLEHGFHSCGEQPYSRRAENSIEEFSVDLAATRYIPKEPKGELSGELNILCECKYRVPGKTWLFMPYRDHPEVQLTWKEVIRCFPSFSSYTFDEGLIRQCCSEFPNALKGIEVHESDVFDKDIRHALNQLRYAMPDLIRRVLFGAIFGHPDDCKPLFILPVLVTNSPIRVLKEDVNLSSVKASVLEDISNGVDVLVVHSESAHEFREHAKAVFSDLSSQSKMSRQMAIVKIAKYLEKEGNFESPLMDLKMLEAGEAIGPGFYSQFLVVTLSAFPALLRKINGVLDESLRDSTQVVFADSPT